jgi:hypothetical protein
MKDIEAVRQAVDDAGGVLTVKVGALRDAYGAGRLGVHVRSGISRALQGAGLGHYPSDLPDWQDQPVRLFKLGSRVADLIDAVLQPGDAHDEELRQAIRGEATETLAKIRELVCA